ncbi:MAG: ketohydroxyglutarate aldolase [Cyanobacteria bacterium SW_11_48_12]|nr:MAG: ketohydroxyglutarate aldolase [Cyanobacteria bacterium SW_11_48_12]
MFADSWLTQLQKHRAIAVIRYPQLELGSQMAKAVSSGGMQLIEITWNSDQPAELVRQLRSELPSATIGAGTILDLNQLREAIASGAQFLFCPHVDSALIQAAVEAGVPIIPGALSPTEIVTAWQAGASCVKVFPVQSVGGVNYIKNLQDPLGQIPLIPTSGVTKENAGGFLEAGAIAVGLSSQLFPQQLVAARDWEGIAERAKSFYHQLVIRNS